ncbi:cobyrinate a,c-diamide synthase [Pseudobutyrivibrio xylanivorans]|uniref:Cobyrinic acid a,c-diamide synthase n=1 Tax=Pseudobutyrivibrio xylanivorans DSM 14809 TaxID=1123012 RepID=A0A1M6CEL1_PSEXY|nr:cobyrinate a,c-diamide synthase [Pseudobutyrivibrio xylanivorans]SHI59460.1 cobyrinic acid a,c-diamide synthase [Pseudobutyrivibrio xylanivorans DSM 14809]
MEYPRVMIAAPRSGSGKTTITCGILRAMINSGLSLCSYKCGPDYIDPMFHRTVLGIPSGNLDTFFTDDSTTRSLFVQSYSGDMAVIEGVMGLYDGIGGVETQGSSYDLARALSVPIVLVVDAKGAGRSIIAQLKGFLDYDEYHLIKAVILNRTSVAFGNTLGVIIEKELGIKYLGTIPEIKDQQLSSRYLGLVMPEEVPEINKKIDDLAEVITENLNLEELKKLASEAAELDIIKEDSSSKFVNVGVVLAVARDEAFCFYYKENLEMLKEAGVKLVEFSPIKDAQLPDGVDGILLGGGYPENYMKELSSNKSMKASIKNAIDSGMPILAECGGFMYLSDSIKNSDNQIYDMVGAIKARVEWKGKLVRFGYVTVDMGELQIKGHEFHYYDTDNNGDCCVATKPFGGKSWNCIHSKNGGYIGFPHLYYPSNPEFINNFVEVMKNYGGH